MDPQTSLNAPQGPTDGAPCCIFHLYVCFSSFFSPFQPYGAVMREKKLIQAGDVCWGREKKEQRSHLLSIRADGSLVYHRSYIYKTHATEAYSAEGTLGNVVLPLRD